MSVTVPVMGEAFRRFIMSRLYIIERKIGSVVKESNLPCLSTLAYETKQAPFLEYPLHEKWLQGLDLNQRPFGYEPNELTRLLYPASENLNVVVVLNAL